MTWYKICIICSSPAEFNIFDKIPPFLHAGPKEHLYWQTPINELIHNTTGLIILPTDGLPHSICAICVSYLKHAVTFRNRAVDNWQNLRAIQLLLGVEKTQTDYDYIKGKTEVIEDEVPRKLKKPLFSVSSDGAIHIKRKKFKKRWNLPLDKPPSDEQITEQLRFLSIKFGAQNFRDRTKYLEKNAHMPKYSDKEFTSSNEEVEDPEPEITSATAGECLFSYNEKHFQEDDVMELNELRDAIAIKEPERCFERKCRACLNRFLFEDTFNEHLSYCAEYKFLLLIEELNLLLEIRRKKAVSPHEYIRRVIFSIRKICDWLASNYNEGISLPTCISKK